MHSYAIISVNKKSLELLIRNTIKESCWKPIIFLVLNFFFFFLKSKIQHVPHERVFASGDAASFGGGVGGGSGQGSLDTPRGPSSSHSHSPSSPVPFGFWRSLCIFDPKCLRNSLFNDSTGIFFFRWNKENFEKKLFRGKMHKNVKAKCICILNWCVFHYDPASYCAHHSYSFWIDLEVFSVDTRCHFPPDHAKVP